MTVTYQANASRSESDPMYRYQGGAEEFDPPFIPMGFQGAGPIGAIFGLGWWIRKYGRVLGPKFYGEAKKVERARSMSSPKPKPGKDFGKSLTDKTMRDLSSLESKNPKAFKNISPKIRKQYGKQKLDFKHKSSQQYQHGQRKSYKNYKSGEQKGWAGGPTMREADKKITRMKKSEAQRARESLNRDKPPSKYNPNKGKPTRRQSLLGPKPRKPRGK